MEMWILTIVIQSIAFALGLFKLWSDLQLKLKELEMRLALVEKQDDEIYTKLDEMLKKLVAIEIALNNKADR
jgi:hypothetical protein